MPPLIERLRRPEVVAPDLAVPAQLSTALGTGSAEIAQPAAQARIFPAPAPRPPRKPLPTLSAQQLLLGVGAVLMLSAASLFLYFAWRHFGVVGQSLIMGAFTAAAVIGSALAAKRNLAAATESAAVIATGFLLLDLHGAYTLNLAGLSRYAFDTYWSVATGVAAGLLLLFDRVARRGNSETLVRTYRPAASIMATLGLWLWISVLDVQHGGLVTAFAALTALSGVGVYASYRFDPCPPDNEGSKRRWRSPLSAQPFLVSMIVAFLCYLTEGFGTGYDYGLSLTQRYSTFALLLLGPAALGWVSVHRREQTPEKYRPAIPIAVAIWLIPILGIPLSDLKYPVLVCWSAVAAALAIAAHFGMGTKEHPVWVDWRRAVTGLIFAAQPLLLWHVWVLSLNNVESFATTSMGGGFVIIPSWMVALPAVFWAVSSLVAAWAQWSYRWGLVSQAAAALAVLFLLREYPLMSLETMMAMLGLALWFAGVAMAADRFRAPEEHNDEGWLFYALLWVFTVVAGVMHLVVGLNIGYDPSLLTEDRYLAFLVLLLTPLLLALPANRLGMLIPVPVAARELFPLFSVGALALVLAIPVTDIPLQNLALMSITLSGFAMLLHIGWLERDLHWWRLWRRAMSGLIFLGQPFLVITVWGIPELNGTTISELAMHPEHFHFPPSVWLLVLPALAWAASSAIAVWTTRSVLWCYVAQGAVLTTAAISLENAVWPGVQAVAAAGLATLGATALAFLTLRPPRSQVVETQSEFLFLAAALAYLIHLCTGFLIGYDFTVPNQDRYTAWAMLALGTLLAGLATTRFGSKVGVSQKVRLVLPTAVVVVASAVLGILVSDLPYESLVGLALLLAVVAVVFHFGYATGTAYAKAWRRPVYWAVAVGQPVVVYLVWLVTSQHALTFADVVLGYSASLTAHPTVVALPAALWCVSSALGAWKTRLALWWLFAEIAAAASVSLLLDGHNARDWVVGLLVLFAINVALGAVAVRRVVAERAAMPEGKKTPNSDPFTSFWATVDLGTVMFSILYAVTSVVAGVSTGVVQWISAALVSVGVLTLLYAASPNRLWFAYLGSLSISAGTAVLMLDADVMTTEAYTAPLVLLLAAIGYVQWKRNPGLPTRLTMGPALSVAFGPSMLASLGEGDEWRLLLIAGLGVMALIAGLQWKLKAPVTVGGVALLFLALTQGGPLMSQTPVWVVLAVSGAVVLTVGTRWEKSVNTGKRAVTKYRALR